MDIITIMCSSCGTHKDVECLVTHDNQFFQIPSNWWTNYATNDIICAVCILTKVTEDLGGYDAEQK